MVLAKLTTIVPVNNPKSAPAAKVRTVAPGNERAVETTYISENKERVNTVGQNFGSLMYQDKPFA